MKYKSLFEPIKIGNINKNLELKNRIVFPSVGTGYYNKDGTIADENINFIEARTKEISLIITTVAASSFRYGKLKFIAAYDDSFIPSLSKFAKAGHNNGAKIFLQLFVMGGPNVLADDAFLDVIPWVPSLNIPMYRQWIGKNKPKELKAHQIREIVDDYSQSARRAKEAGFDGVEIKANEDYLLATFLTPYFNRRTDEYGGSFENIMRFPLEIIAEIKKVCGNDFPIGFKYNIYYDSPVGGGVDLELGIKIGERIAKEGVSYLHINPYGKNNIPYSLLEPTTMPNQYQPRNISFPFAAHLKASVRDTAIMPVSGILKPDEAARFIGEGKADLVAVARALVADELWAKKARNSKRFRPCTKCYVCLHEAAKGSGLDCSINPNPLGKKSKELKEIYAPKNIMVVGGGPGGIMAALTAAKRGHNVTLYEKNNEVGGALIINSMLKIKYEFTDLLNYYKEEINESRVKVVTGFNITPEFVRKIKPDVLIVSIGAKPISLNIPVLEENEIVDVISAIKNAKNYKNKNIIVIGGGNIGCEAALLFRREGNTVTIVEESDKLMKDDIMIYNALVLERMLRKEWVNIRTNSKATRIHKNYARIEDNYKNISNLTTDLIIAAVGLEPLLDETKSLTESCDISYSLGDCVKPDRIRQAVHEGYRIGNLV
jgi:2,4-dienoyl-CoA reductase-like NADH-dependent reductase (Old Yellow Enzyme family)/thioredoxin reductase